MPLSAPLITFFFFFFWFVRAQGLRGAAPGTKAEVVDLTLNVQALSVSAKPVGPKRA